MGFPEFFLFRVFSKTIIVILCKICLCCCSFVHEGYVEDKRTFIAWLRSATTGISNLFRDIFLSKKGIEVSLFVPDISQDILADINLSAHTRYTRYHGASMTCMFRIQCIPYFSALKSRTKASAATNSSAQGDNAGFSQPFHYFRLFRLHVLCRANLYYPVKRHKRHKKILLPPIHTTFSFAKSWGSFLWGWKFLSLSLSLFQWSAILFSLKAP